MLRAAQASGTHSALGFNSRVVGGPGYGANAHLGGRPSEPQTPRHLASPHGTCECGALLPACLVACFPRLTPQTAAVPCGVLAHQRWGLEQEGHAQGRGALLLRAVTLHPIPSHSVPGTGWPAGVPGFCWGPTASCGERTCCWLCGVCCAGRAACSPGNGRPAPWAAWFLCRGTGTVMFAETGAACGERLPSAALCPQPHSLPRCAPSLPGCPPHPVFLPEPQPGSRGQRRSRADAAISLNLSLESLSGSRLQWLPSPLTSFLGLSCRPGQGVPTRPGVKPSCVDTNSS